MCSGSVTETHARTQMRSTCRNRIALALFGFCPSACLAACLSYTCLYVCPSISLSDVCWHVCLSVCLSTRLSVVLRNSSIMNESETPTQLVASPSVCSIISLCLCVCLYFSLSEINSCLLHSLPPRPRILPLIP